MEEQCFDRSHRLGQTKEVIITKVRISALKAWLYTSVFCLRHFRIFLDYLYLQNMALRSWIPWGLRVPIWKMRKVWKKKSKKDLKDEINSSSKSFFIFQYIVTNSVEERMLTMQEQKRELMGQAFGVETQSQEDRRQARVRDIKHLIGL